MCTYAKTSFSSLARISRDGVILALLQSAAEGGSPAEPGQPDNPAPASNQHARRWRCLATARQHHSQGEGRRPRMHSLKPNSRDAVLYADFRP